MPRSRSRNSRGQKLVPCKSHQYRNPKTNRCKNKSRRKRSSSRRVVKRRSPSRSRKLVPCKSHQYRNKNNKCVNKSNKRYGGNKLRREIPCKMYEAKYGCPKHCRKPKGKNAIRCMPKKSRSSRK